VWEKTGSTILFVTHNVDEAVFMSDRILVMSNIPSRIIAEYDIDLTRPRIRASSESREFRSKILEVLRVEQEKALKM
jgi:NitT/TauT family transport system ATP-binding protein